MVRRREVRGSVTDAVKAVTPTAAVSYAADVMSDISDVHIPPNVSMLLCEKRLPSPRSLDIHIGRNVYPEKISKCRRKSCGI